MVNCPLASWWTYGLSRRNPIARIYVKNGDRVNKGQKIAELATFRLTNKTAQAKDA